ncbi:MAG: UDP-N-acetylglucosamine 4,6-dehydratase (inverting) [Chlamydiia bacterium]|nr:UDP-N-acetylglucosamine 4,6-dehydratase (inverting) [Chlamydiia bacterium]
MDSNQVFKSKVVLITGGTGSFGKTFARRLLQEDQVQKVIIFSRDELKQWEMKDSEEIFNHPKIRYFLGDVRDKERLIRSFSEVDYVVHAAALKQVPAAEYNPTEFIKTNVQGAINVIDAAIAQGVEKVVALSSDKAVNPVNLYGATKLCSDKLFVAAESYVGHRSYPTFSVVRYGNVVGSRGSVLPYWKKLIKNGAKTLPLTDPRMTRFWITLDESVDLVFKALELSQGSEIFVPKIPSIKLTDLAEALLPGSTPEIIGIRPGEKLHELMISSDDARHTLEFDDHFLIYPEKYSQDSKKLSRLSSGKALEEGFSYTSENNPEWLSTEELKSYLGAK